MVVRTALVGLFLLLLAGSALAQDGTNALEGSAWLDGYSPAAQGVLEYSPELEPSEGTAQKLTAILAQPEYQSDPVGPTGKSWLARLLDWLNQKLSGWHLPGGGGNVAGWISALLISAVIILLVYLVVRLIWAIVNRSAAGSSSSDKSKLGPLTRDDLLSAAALAAEQGDFATALRLRFRALLQLIDLPATTILTNHQIARRLSKQCAAATPNFTALVGQFEDVWYGSQPCDQANYRHAAGLAVEVESLLKREEDADAED